MEVIIETVFNLFLKGIYMAKAFTCNIFLCVSLLFKITPMSLCSEEFHIHEEPETSGTNLPSGSEVRFCFYISLSYIQLKLTLTTSTKTLSEEFLSFLFKVFVCNISTRVIKNQFRKTWLVSNNCTTCLLFLESMFKCSTFIGEKS